MVGFTDVDTLPASIGLNSIMPCYFREVFAILYYMGIQKQPHRLDAAVCGHLLSGLQSDKNEEVKSWRQLSVWNTCVRFTGWATKRSLR